MSTLLDQRKRTRHGQATALTSLAKRKHEDKSSVFDHRKEQSPKNDARLRSALPDTGFFRCGARGWCGCSFDRVQP